MLDTKTKMEILSAVRAAVRQTLEDAEEQWITGEELCRQFQCFTPGWLKRYGERLSRTQAVTIDKYGNEHTTGWVYPKHRIQRLIQENKLVFQIEE